MPYTPPVFHRSTSSATERFRNVIHHVSDAHSNSNSTSTRTTDSVSSFLEQFISHVFSYRHSRSGLSSWWMRTFKPRNTGYREIAACGGKNGSSVDANTPHSSPESTTSPCQSHENSQDSSSSTSVRPTVMQTVVKRAKPIGHSRLGSSTFHTHHVSRKGYVKRQTASSDPEAESSSSVGSSSSIGASSSSFEGLSISISISIGLPLFPGHSSLPPSGSTTTQTSATSASETSTPTSDTSTSTTETSTSTSDTSTDTSTLTSFTTTSTTLSTTSESSTSTSDTTFSTSTESSASTTSSSTSLTSSSTIPATITFSTTPTSSSSSSRSVITLTANSTSISTTNTSVSSTFTTTTFTLFPTTTDLPTITEVPSTLSVPSLTTSGVLNTQTPSFSSRFAQNQGAIIGVTVGGVVALVLIVTAVFFFCARWRRTRRTTQTPAAVTSGLIRGHSKATSSRRTLMRNPSSNISWRPPLSDEYDDPEDHVQMSQVPIAPIVAGVGVPTSPSHSSHEGDVSTSGHGHSLNLSHEQSPPSSPPVPSSSQTGDEMTRRPSLPRQMPGLGQVSETMRIATVELSPSSPPVSPTFSLSPQPLPTAVYGSSSSHDHSSTELGGTSSLVHSNTVITSASSSSGSHSHSHSSHHTNAPVPRVRIQEASPTSSLRERTSSTGSFRGLISRLRGGRSSTQDIPSGSLKGKERADRVPAPASFYYPGTSPPTRASSLLNPPLPLSSFSQQPAEMHPFSVNDLPLPTPDEELAPEGLLDPQLVGKELPTRPSLGSLRDNVDYSRPYRGFVFNRMGSSATFTTQDTRSTQLQRTPGVETPGSLFALDDTLGERSEYPFGTTTTTER